MNPPPRGDAEFEQLRTNANNYGVECAPGPNRLGVFLRHGIPQPEATEGVEKLTKLYYKLVANTGLPKPTFWNLYEECRAAFWAFHRLADFVCGLNLQTEVWNAAVIETKKHVAAKLNNDGQRIADDPDV